MTTIIKNCRHDGAIAQLVEQRTENPCVPGSIPGGTTPPFIRAVLARGRSFFITHYNGSALKSALLIQDYWCLLKLEVEGLCIYNPNK